MIRPEEDDGVVVETVVPELPYEIPGPGIHGGDENAHALAGRFADSLDRVRQCRGVLASLHELSVAAAAETGSNQP